MSSTLSERRGPEPPFLQGEGRWGERGPLAAPSHCMCLSTPKQQMCRAPSYLSAVVWGRR